MALITATTPVTIQIGDSIHRQFHLTTPLNFRSNRMHEATVAATKAIWSGSLQRSCMRLLPSPYAFIFGIDDFAQVPESAHESQFFCLGGGRIHQPII
jgi:hypothetical protein